MRRKKERKKTKLAFLVDFFLASHILEGTFEGTYYSDGLCCVSLSVALVVVCQAIKPCQAIANLAKSQHSRAIPKYRTLPRSLIWCKEYYRCLQKHSTETENSLRQLEQ